MKSLSIPVGSCSYRINLTVMNLLPSIDSIYLGMGYFWTLYIVCLTVVLYESDNFIDKFSNSGWFICTFWTTVCCCCCWPDTTWVVFLFIFTLNEDDWFICWLLLLTLIMLLLTLIVCCLVTLGRDVLMLPIDCWLTEFIIVGWMLIRFYTLPVFVGTNELLD